MPNIARGILLSRTANYCRQNLWAQMEIRVINISTLNED